MEIRDRLKKRGGREIGEHLLKAAESLTGFVKQLRICHGIIAGRIGNKEKCAPEFSALIDEKPGIVCRRNQVQRLAEWISSCSRDFFPQKRGHLCNILHQLRWIVENSAVHTLQNRFAENTVFGGAHQKRIVDMAVPVRRPVCNRSRESKCVDNGREFFLCVCNHHGYKLLILIIARPENNAKKEVLQSANCKEQI